VLHENNPTVRDAGDAGGYPLLLAMLS